MKVTMPGVNYIFEIGQDYVNELVIENPKLLTEILDDIITQIAGGEGKFVVSENDKILQPGKKCELLDKFVPFEINKKQLINKLASEIEKIAVSSDDYEATMEMLSNIERYFDEISLGLIGDIVFNKLTLASIIKAVSPGFQEDYENLAEKILDYFELVTEYEGDKLFIVLNIRSFLSVNDMEQLLKDSIQRNYKVFLIESCERKKLKNTKRYLIDNDLCEIC